MTPQEVLIAAKQRNPQAIAALVNRHLKPQGFTAKVKLTDGCLHVMVEGVTVPEQGAIVPYIVKGMRGLGVDGVSSLTIYGKAAGDEMPAWSDQVELGEIPSKADSTFEIPTPEVTQKDEPLKQSEPIKQAEKKPLSVFQKITGVIGLVWIVLWFMHSCGYPHNCEEAKEDLAKEESQLDRDLVNHPGNLGALNGQVMTISRAKSKMLDKCYAKQG